MTAPTNPTLRIVERVRSSKVNRVYLAVIDHDEGEGVFTILGPAGQKLPLVALDERALPALQRYSQNVANEVGKKVSIISFTGRAVCESFSPIATGD